LPGSRLQQWRRLPRPEWGLRKRKWAAEAAHLIVPKRLIIQIARVSDRPQAFRRAFAAARIAYDLERNLLTFLEAAKARAFNRRNVNENVLRPVIRLDETVTLGAVEPFDCASGHVDL